MDDEIRIPDVEIIVGAGGSDVAVFCFYQRGDIHQGYDVVAGITGKDARPVIRTLLLDALKSLDVADWYDVDVLRAQSFQGEDDPPF